MEEGYQSEDSSSGSEGLPAVRLAPLPKRGREITDFPGDELVGGEAAEKLAKRRRLDSFEPEAGPADDSSEEFDEADLRLYDHHRDEFDAAKHSTEVYWFGYLVVPQSVRGNKNYYSAVKDLRRVSENFRDVQVGPFAMSDRLARALIPLRDPDTWNGTAENYIDLLRTAVSALGN